MENKYQITGYQLVYANGGRDTVKLQTPVIISDIEDTDVRYVLFTTVSVSTSVISNCREILPQCTNYKS